MVIRLNRRQAEYVRDILQLERERLDDADMADILTLDKDIKTCDEVLEILEDVLDA